MNSSFIFIKLWNNYAELGNIIALFFWQSSQKYGVFTRLLCERLCHMCFLNKTQFPFSRQIGKLSLKLNTFSPDILYAVTFLTKSIRPISLKHFSTRFTLSDETMSSFSSSAITSRKHWNRSDTMECMSFFSQKLLSQVISH